jgi:benzoyl-CoA reductase subunit BamC
VASTKEAALPGVLPSRDYFIEPDSGLPLKCDMCEDEPALAQPLCVTVCQPGCLAYEERQVETEVNDIAEREAMERGLESLANQHGMQVVIDNVKRLSKRQ